MHSSNARIFPRRSRPPAPIPKKTIPGSPNQIAYIGPRIGAATVVTGRAVVVRFKVEVTGVAPTVTGVVVKLQPAALGTFALHVSDTVAPNTGCGVRATVYTAVCPADTVWFAGPTVTWKSEPRAVTVGADTMVNGLPQETETAPPLKLN